MVLPLQDLNNDYDINPLSEMQMKKMEVCLFELLFTIILNGFTFLTLKYVQYIFKYIFNI